MKKTIGFLLLFTLIFTVCGCQNNDIDVRGKYENDTTRVSSDISSDTNLSTEEFSLGNITGNVYKNDFIGISYKLDENWTFYNDEQIKELNNITVDMAGDEVEELVKNATIVYDMCATDGDQLNNIIINLEKVSNRKLFSLNIEENLKTLVPILMDGSKNMGYENIDYEIIDVEVDGKMLDALHTTAEINGVNMYQTMFQKKCNGYLASITITTYFYDAISDLIDNFYWTE
ncbi:MAG: hypothetical protein IJE46_01345 [Clostridia bacterium]|nr:hypothetical protein [Clostridia bacterium]